MIEKGDYLNLVDKNFLGKKFLFNTRTECLERASHFSKDIKYAEYYQLYRNLLNYD